MIPLLLLLLAAAWQPVFRNAAREAGLTHSIPNGGSASKKYIIETTGSGAGLIDLDNDGDLDAVVVSGDGGATRVYRNDGQGRFSPMASLGSGWGQGVCAGDYDNDGYTDFAVTYWGGTVLYHNRGGKAFEEVQIGAGAKRYNTGCAFLDYDRDGDLDLFVANYLRFDYAAVPLPGANPYCYYREMPVNCGPRGLYFDRNQLFRNEGGGRFTDVSEASGIALPSKNYSLGVLTGDFNDDGWPDVFVACDQTPSLLYINQRDGSFKEEALLRGVALDEHGKALSGMGATSADFDGDGLPDIFRTNFSDERETLYRNRGDGDFDEVTAAAGLAHNTSYVGWGCGFFDYDNDGWPDLLLVNGHVFPEVDKLPGEVRFRERAILYHNTGTGRFEDVSRSAGPAITEAHVARGAAFGDVDGNGTVDVLINNQNETPSLWKLSARPAGNWIRVRLTGTRSNRSAIGARIRVTAGGRTQTAEVRSGGSYLSQSDLAVHFGLGAAARVDRVEIRWPNGRTQTAGPLAVNSMTTIAELY